MLPATFRGGIKNLTYRKQIIYRNTYEIVRNVTTTQTLEPVTLSYATYDSSGTKAHAPPLVILHGLFGSKSNWATLCKDYQRETVPPRKVIAIDVRNHGESQHSDNHTYAHVVADVKAFLEQFKMKKVALIGHSMGGRAVMLFTLKYVRKIEKLKILDIPNNVKSSPTSIPELVDRLIVGDISPVTTSPNLNSIPTILQALDSVDFPSNMSMSRARAAVDSQLSKAIPEKYLRSFLLTNLVQKDNGSYNWRMNVPALLSNFNHISRFPLVSDLQYKGPVLFVGGGNSDFIHINIKFLSSSSEMFACFHHFKQHIKRLSISFTTSLARTKSFQQADLLQVEDNFDLSYASYELTESYSRNGRKPIPLVLLHGLMCSKNNWNSFCKRFHESKKNKVFALDARNHGDSPHSREHSYDNLVIDLRRFLHKMDIPKVYLLGHSMGGRAVMLFALKYPDLVEKLVVADMSPITTSQNFKKLKGVLLALKRIHLPRNVPLSAARKLVNDILVPLVKSHSTRAFLLTNLVQKNDGSYGWRFNLNAIMDNLENMSTFPEIHNVIYQGPVLFIGGGKSDYIQKSDYPKILKLFPNAQLKYIEGAGHFLHSEKPSEFLNITLDFLNK